MKYGMNEIVNRFLFIRNVENNTIMKEWKGRYERDGMEDHGRMIRN